MTKIKHICSDCGRIYDSVENRDGSRCFCGAKFYRSSQAQNGAANQLTHEQAKRADFEAAATNQVSLAKTQTKQELSEELQEMLDRTIEHIMAESSREPDGERLWVKTSYELADIIRPILSQELHQAELKANERVEKIKSSVEKIWAELHKEDESDWDLLHDLSADIMEELDSLKNKETNNANY